ncbi:hypothetical protein C487_18501 [Natrinema pallidum DSM 3751]|uniref:Uncharacterized protein n=1 Tax=Natrinema pallidum DSM 3751 TaxID=1227495 RepID=L9YGL0_9EURY|nr:hypothetical protein C487_18501 [Natrinema pallidum DSM 3751]
MIHVERRRYRLESRDHRETEGTNDAPGGRTSVRGGSHGESVPPTAPSKGVQTTGADERADFGVRVPTI